LKDTHAPIPSSLLLQHLAFTAALPLLHDAFCRYGNTTATDAEVVAAAKAAQVHDSIERTPDGYATRVNQSVRVYIVSTIGSLLLPWQRT